VYTPDISQRVSGVDRYFHEDWLGSNRYLTDGTGNSAPSAYRFDAYGLPSAQAGSDNPSLKFAGQEEYQSGLPRGLQQLGLRAYDPAMERFLSPDPIGFGGGLNLYAYCGGDPVNLIDPDGTDAGWAQSPYWNDP